ncbi:MAG: YggS family pyridoxal phosphate-dependent enzyme [Chitinophagales bacterium]
MGTRYSEIKNYCHHNHVTLVAISKTRTPDQILELNEQGQKIFGENKVQELVVKHETVNKSIEWHLVGHLQTNKVKFVVPFVSLIQSVDSWKLLLEINKQAKQNNRVVDVLLQIHIGRELTKFGLSFQEAREILHHPELAKLNRISIKGLMGMASLTDNENQIRSEFRSLKLFFEEMKSGVSGLQMTGSDPATLSMGMSNDFRIAIEEGSTMVRIGSAIFGG